MTSYHHSTTLFTTDGNLPMKFSMRPCEERVKLKPIIEHGGGTITSKSTLDSIRLAEPGSIVYSDSCVSSKYIWDCVKKNELLNIENYRVHHESDVSDVSGFEDNFEQFNQKEVHRKYRVKREYTLAEDNKMIEYICSNRLYTEVKGRNMWQAMEICKILGNRTWQSMRERFIKRILPKLDSYNVPNCNTKYLKNVVGALSENEASGFETNCRKSNLRNQTDINSTILNYVLQGKRYKRINEITLWKEMELEIISDSMLWRDLRDRFYKNIIPSISGFTIEEQYRNSLSELIAQLSPEKRKQCSPHFNHNNKKPRMVPIQIVTSKFFDSRAKDIDLLNRNSAEVVHKKLNNLIPMKSKETINNVCKSNQISLRLKNKSHNSDKHEMLDGSCKKLEVSDPEMNVNNGNEGNLKDVETIRKDRRSHLFSFNMVNDSEGRSVLKMSVFAPLDPNKDNRLLNENGISNRQADTTFRTENFNGALNNHYVQRICNNGDALLLEKQNEKHSEKQKRISTEIQERTAEKIAECSSGLQSIESEMRLEQNSHISKGEKDPVKNPTSSEKNVDTLTKEVIEKFPLSSPSVYDSKKNYLTNRRNNDQRSDRFKNSRNQIVRKKISLSMGLDESSDSDKTDTCTDNDDESDFVSVIEQEYASLQKSSEICPESDDWKCIKILRMMLGLTHFEIIELLRITNCNIRLIFEKCGININHSLIQ